MTIRMKENNKFNHVCNILLYFFHIFSLKIISEKGLFSYKCNDFMIHSDTSKPTRATHIHNNFTQIIIMFNLYSMCCSMITLEQWSASELHNLVNLICLFIHCWWFEYFQTYVCLFANSIYAHPSLSYNLFCSSRNRFLKIPVE